MNSPDLRTIPICARSPLDFPKVALHWHDEMELIYIKKGSGEITLDLNAYEVCRREHCRRASRMPALHFLGRTYGV
jgi:hypothetical protein